MGKTKCQTGKSQTIKGKRYRVRQERQKISGIKRQTDICTEHERIDSQEGIRKTEGNIQGIGQTEINPTDENETKSRTQKTFG